MSTSLQQNQSRSVIEVISNYVSRQEIAGAVVLVAQNGQVVEFDATGYADLENRRAMSTDSLFWIASMTKPIIAAAIMTLVDEKRLSVQDEVSKFLPEFKDLHVQEGEQEGKLILVPARTLTLFHLLTHTDGLADTPLPSSECTLAQWVSAIPKRPALFHAGSCWQYNNSGMNALGRIIELVSGESLSDFLSSRFFEPLGMTQTTFFPNRQQLKNLALTYNKKTEGTGLQREGFDADLPVSMDLQPLPRPVFPGGGLFSIATDVFAFYQMLLDGGVREGRRYLSTQTHHELTRIQTGPLEAGFTPGMSFGLGVGVVREPQGLTQSLSAGTYGHGGACGTQVWMDPVRKSVSIFLCQRRNLTPNPDASELRCDFNEAVFKLVRRKKESVA